MSAPTVARPETTLQSSVLSELGGRAGLVGTAVLASDIVYEMS